jgi:ArsR family transcriptional regulator
MQNVTDVASISREIKINDEVTGELNKEELFDAIKKKEFSREAEIFKALGHPIRLKIVYGLLKVGGCNVKNMQECLGLHQATVSQHLIHLKTRGIIQSDRQGLEMVYTVTDTWAKCIVDNIEKNRIEPLNLKID